MKVLVVGGGGREHALVWKIAQDKRVKEIFAAPGNGGIADLATLVDIKADDITKLLDFAKNTKIDLTVVGPEVPLVKGIVDEFEKNNLRVFGPGKKTAKLEGSKVFAKELMKELGVPTADFRVFDKKDEALTFIKEKNTSLVVKADGLAAGKGVFVCANADEANEAVKSIMVEKAFGASGDKIIIEECLEGEEASIIVVSDGENIVPLASSQDHKRIFDNDLGPNTGGMGAYSPAPAAEGKVFQDTIDKIIYPIIKGLKSKGMPHKGILYAGIMITKNGPYVLEFNVRLGDPETQAILPRMDCSLIDLINASIDGKLSSFKNKWDKKPCVSIVAASGGYPGNYKKEIKITGLKEAGSIKDAIVFHAGTKKSGKDYVTTGGRVLGITALGENIEKAVKKAYESAEKIHFDGMHYRKDIAKRALTH